MQFFVEFLKDGKVIEAGDNPERTKNLVLQMRRDFDLVKITDMLTTKTYTYSGLDDFDEFFEARNRASQWAPEVTQAPIVIGVTLPTEIINAVNASHHKGVIDDYQWVDTEQRHRRYRDRPEVFEGAIELQVRKYLSRLGAKDNDLQEMLKCLWYMKYLCAIRKMRGQMILAADVDKILAS